jgi:hypothetical protein
MNVHYFKGKAVLGEITFLFLEICLKRHGHTRMRNAESSKSTKISTFIAF